MATTESLNDIVSRIVLQHNMVDEDQLDEALALQREIIHTSEGKKPSLERVLLDMGIIKGKQLKGLRYAIIYYLVRKADRFYAKIAVQSDICEPKWINEALREQKRIHLKERRLVRINKILIEKGYINAREDRAILRSIEGLRERRRKRGGGKDAGKPGSKGKRPSEESELIAALSGSGEEETRHDGKGGRAADARSPAGLSDEELQDLEDLGEDLDELSRNQVDETVGVQEDDPKSLAELEALSGIGDTVSPEEVAVDDTAETDQNELLSSGSSLGELDDEDLAAPEEEDPTDDLAADEAARTAGSGSEAGEDEEADEDALGDVDLDVDDEDEDEAEEEEEEVDEEEDTFDSQDDDLGDLDEEEAPPAKAKGGKTPPKAAPAGKASGKKGKPAADEDEEPVVGGPASSSADLDDEDLDDADDLDDLEDEDEPKAKKPAAPKSGGKKPAGKKPADEDEDELEDEDEPEEEEPRAKGKKSAAKDEDEADEEPVAEDIPDKSPKAPPPEPKKKGGLFSFFRREKSAPAPRPAGGKKTSGKKPKASGKADAAEAPEGQEPAAKAPGKKSLADTSKKSGTKRLGR